MENELEGATVYIGMDDDGILMHSEDTDHRVSPYKFGRPSPPDSYYPELMGCPARPILITRNSWAAHLCPEAEKNHTARPMGAHWAGGRPMAFGRPMGT